MLAVITVTSFADDGGSSKLTLREAIDTANINSEGDIIRFSTDPADGLNGATILLTQGELNITEAEDLTIDASMLSAGITIDAGDGDDEEFGTFDGHRIFDIFGDTNTDVEIIGLTLTGGDTPRADEFSDYPGGAIRSTANLTIRQSTIEDNASGWLGGGIWMQGATLIVEDSNIIGNRSGGESTEFIHSIHSGGGIYFNGANLQVVGSTISGNTSIGQGGLTLTGAFGGGLYAVAQNGSISITQSKFDNNRLVDSYTVGGGVYLRAVNSSVAISNTTITNNEAVGLEANGGGLAMVVSNSPGVVELSGLVMSNNYANDDIGGIYLRNVGSAVKLMNSTISGNKAAHFDNEQQFGTDDDAAGGAWIRTASGGETTIENCTISDNETAMPLNSTQANLGGGGLFIVGSAGTTTTVRNSTISGNRSEGPGAGIKIADGYQGSVFIRHSTITNNRADSDGDATGNGGGLSTGGVSGTVTLDHTIVAGNLRGTDSTRSDIVGAVSASWSLIGDNTGATITNNGGNQIGTSSMPKDPGLGPLTYNGGPVFLDGSGMRTHALLPTSLAVNMGDPNFDPLDPDDNPNTDDAIPHDQRGDPWTRVAGSRIDIGAFEWRPYAPTGDYNIDGFVDAVDYTVWRNTFGSTIDLRADGNQNGVIDTGDYGFWKNAYGDVLFDPSGNGVTDIADYFVWQATYGSTTDLRADCNEDGIVDDEDFDIWFDTFGSTMEIAEFGLLSGMFDPDAPPAVVGFALSLPNVQTLDFAGKTGSGEQLRSLPLIAANTLSITFNRNVSIAYDALELVNLDGASPTLFDFDYDSLSQTATWTFLTSLADGRYLARLSDSVESLDGDALDGEFANPWTLGETGTATFPSGDGREGGEFRFRFTVLGDDADHDNVDGSTDYQHWHSAEPGMVLVSSLEDELDADDSYGDVSLREALAIAAAQAGSDTIVFASSLFSSGPATITLSYDGADAGTAPDVLTIGGGVVIDGPGANVLSVSGNNQTGVFYVPSGVVAIRDLRITGGNTFMGGGINSAGDLSLNRVQIEGNSASVGGGIRSHGTLRVTNSTLAGNTATNAGGGLFVADGSATVLNSTISGNAAASGGGIYADMGAMQVVNATITANRASSGSGILSWVSTLLHNSIVAGNLTAAGAPTTNDILGSFHSSSACNLIGYDGSLANGINNGTNDNQVGGELGASAINALLSSLDYYGNEVKVHLLLEGSPAIDAGSNAAAIAFWLEADARGEVRIADWLGDDLEAIIDIGAVELGVGEVYP